MGILIIDHFVEPISGRKPRLSPLITDLNRKMILMLPPGTSAKIAVARTLITIASKDGTHQSGMRHLLRNDEEGGIQLGV